MKRVLLVIVAAVAVFFGILMAVPGFIDWNKHRQDMVTKLAEATGHHYAIDGGVDLAILPFPHVVIEKVSIAPKQGAEPLIAMERAEVSVALMPLLSGKVNVSSIALVKPDIRIGVAADGTPSWMTPVLKEKMSKKDGQDAGGASLADAVAINDVRIKDGSFSYADGKSGKIYALKDIDLSMHADTLKGPFSADGSFEYNGQSVQAEVKSGRLEKGNDSVAVQVDIKVPAAGARIGYSGVVALKDGVEVQGETSIAAQNPGALAQLSGGQAVTAFSKPLDIKGILTASATGTALRDMTFSYAGAGGKGALVLGGLKEAALDINAALEMTGPVNLDQILPAADKKAAAGKGFFPESLTLPRALAAKFSFSAPSAVYKGVSYDKISASGSLSGNKGEAAFSAGTPGNGSVKSSVSIAWAGMSRSEKTGAVTLSDPTMSYDFDMKAAEPEKALQAFVPADAFKGIAPLVRDGLAVRAKGDVKPDRINFSEAYLKLAQSAFDLNGSFVPGAGGKRSHLKIGVAADAFDSDAFAVKLSGEKKPQAVAQPQSVRAMVEKVSLPFDLDMNAALKNVRLKGREYAAINAVIRLDSKKLEIKTLDLQEKGGNSLLVSGAVGELKTLKDIDMSVQGKTADAKGLLQGFGVNADSLPQSIEAAEIVSEFKGHADSLAFTVNLRAANGTLDTSGRLANVLAAPVISDLTLRLRHPNYVEMARMFKPDFNSGVDIRKTLDVFANVKQEGKVYTLSAVQAQIGPATVAGDVRIDMAGSKPSITAKAQAGDVPLDKILGHDASHKGTQRITPQKGGGAQDVRWSRNAIDTQWMNKFNLDLTGSAQSFSYGPWNFSNAALDVDLNDGVLTISRISGGMHGGQVNLTGKASSGANPRDPVSAEGHVEMQNVSLESFVSAFSGSRIVKAKGTISMETDVKSTGLSPAALIFDLNGGGKASGSNLVFEGFDLARLSRTLAQPSSSMTENFTALLDTSMSGGSTKFDTLDSTFTITEGVVNFNKLALAGPDATVNSPGSINLPLWTIDMESTIQLVEPKDAPPLKAVFKGPLDNPGQTFAKSAMDGYFRSLIGNKVQDAIINKLQDKGGGDTGQVLQGIIGGLTGQQPAPQQPAAPQPAAPEAQQPAAGQETATQPAPQKQQEITPEDVFQGVLEGVLGGR